MLKNWSILKILSYLGYLVATRYIPQSLEPIQDLTLLPLCRLINNGAPVSHDNGCYHA